VVASSLQGGTLAKDTIVPHLTRAVMTRAIGLAVLGGLAALGVNTVGSRPAAGASTAGATGATVSTVTFAVDMQVRMPTHQAVDLRAHGQVDFANHAAELSTSLPGTTSSPVHATWVDAQAYVTVPASLSALAGGATALSVPVSTTLRNRISTDLDQSAVALTYAHVLLGVLAKGEHQSRAGTRTINGVAAIGTSVTLTLGQLSKVLPGLSTLLTTAGSGVSDQAIPVTVWVDHQGRLVQVTMAGTSNAAQASFKGTVQFSGYDAPVSITAPPAGSTKAMSATVRHLLAGLDPFGDFLSP
jgi:hypothetical protein